MPVTMVVESGNAYLTTGGGGVKRAQNKENLQELLFYKFTISTRIMLDTEC